MKNLHHLLPLALAAGNVMATPIVDIDFATWSDGNSDGNLDDGERIQDVSGNGYHGFWGATNSNIPFVTTTSGSTAIDTSGTANGKVFLRDGLNSIPDAWDGGTTTTTPYFTFDGTQSYTFEAVVNWNSTTQSINGLMGQIGGNELWIRERDGFIQYAFVSGTANANLFSNTIDVTSAKADGNWHGIAVVYDAAAGEIRTYVDGTLKHTNTDADIGTLGTMVNGANDFFVGAYNGVSNNYFDGLQDRYRISTGALAPAAFLTVPPAQTNKDITWTGTTDGNWDLVTTGNWKLDSDSSPALFEDFDQVTFDDSSSPFGGAVTIVGSLTPSQITVDASSIDYTLSGGSVTGSADLTKAGTSTLTLTADFSNTGAITVDGGNLVVGDGATAGSIGIGSVSLAGGTSLTLDRSDTVNYSAASNLKNIGGAGSFRLDGGGTLIVNPGSNIAFDEANSWSTLSGSVTVIGNSELQTLRNGRTALGSGTVTLGDGSSSGALAQYNGSWAWTNDIALVGSANAIRNRSSNAFPRQLKLQGVISGSGGLIFEDPNGTMTDNQTGYILTGESTTDGTITIDTGVPVRVGGVPGDTNVTENGPDAAGSLGTATIINNGFLTYSRTDSHTVANTISGDGQLFIGLDAGTETQVVNLTGAVSNTGSTTVRSGTLLINGTHGSQIPETLSQLNVGPGATLGGGGTTTSDINLEGTLSPGNSTGTLATDNWLFLLGDSSYTWEFSQWTGGVPGTDSDLVTADEIHIDSSAVPATPITITISPDALSGFAETSQTFVIATSANGIADFNTDAFAIDDSAFVSATGATGTWDIQQNVDDLELVYTAGAGLAGYALWIDGFYPGSSDPQEIGADADPDKDGVANAIEMLLGGNPSLAGDVTLPTVSESGSDLTLVFERDDQAIGAIDVTVETSVDLVSWPPGDAVTVGETSGPGVSIINNGATDTVTVTIPKDGAITRFARIRAVVP